MNLKSNKDPYAELGVSSSKDGVHEAIKDLPKGLYPGAFCKILEAPEIYPNNFIRAIAKNRFLRNIFGFGEFVKVMHTDGAGTKSNLAYLMKMENNPNYLEYFRSLAQDVAVMNIDDMAAVGAIDNIYFSNHIARNSNRIKDEEYKAVIEGYTDFFNLLKQYDIKIIEAGGETADSGSNIPTISLDATTEVTFNKKDVIDCSNIRPGNYIVGVSSAGQAIYEKKYNSGMRCNGLSLGVNVTLCSYYRKYLEVLDSTLDINLFFRGIYYLNDMLEGTTITIGEALLSATRTYTPILKRIYKEKNIRINGIIHCTGGGLTKCKKFGKNIRYVKSDLLPIPPLFDVIKNAGNIDARYMFSTFNMGIGEEIIVDNKESAWAIIEICREFNVEAKIIGYIEKTTVKGRNEVVINNKYEPPLYYSHKIK